MSRAPDFVISILKQYWVPGQKILEIGCGPAFLRDEFGKDYLGVDITDEPYNEHYPRDVDIVCSSDKLLVENKTVDVVIIKSAFYMFSNHEKSLKEAKRVLKNKGKILIFDYNKRTQKELQRKEGHENYPCWTQWGLEKLIKNNGFKNVHKLVADVKQPFGFKRYYHMLRQEVLGTWAVVCGEK